MEELKIGMKATSRWTVTDEMTAEHCQSGFLPVFSTPALVALMESAACLAIVDAVPEGSTSVGATIDLQHSAPSPVGETVEAEAVLTGIDGRKLYFDIVARDGHGLIGTAKHTRAIVDAQRFMDKLKNR